MNVMNIIMIVINILKNVMNIIMIVINILMNVMNIIMNVIIIHNDLRGGWFDFGVTLLWQGIL